MKRAMIKIGVLAAAVAAVVVIARGHEYGKVRTVPAEGDVSLPPQSQESSPRWREPLVGGIPVPPSIAHSRGNLAFSLVLPNLSVAPTATFVTDPAETPAEMRSFAATYVLPDTAEMPDGRLLVLESPSQVTEEQLAQVGQENAAKFGIDHFQLVPVGSHVGLLVQNAGVARLHFVAGTTSFDVTGPATPRAVVLDVGQRLAENLPGD